MLCQRLSIYLIFVSKTDKLELTRTEKHEFGLVQTECPALVPNVQNGSQNMLSTVPLLSTTSRGSARSWAQYPISFESVVFKLGAKTSAGHLAPSLNTTLSNEIGYCAQERALPLEVVLNNGTVLNMFCEPF